MIFIIEPKVGNTNKSIIKELKEIGVTPSLKGDQLVADLTFDQVCLLKDKAYCTHEESDES